MFEIAIAVAVPVLSTIIGFAGSQLRRLSDKISALEIAMAKCVTYDDLGNKIGSLHEKANAIDRRVAKLEP